MTFIQPGLAPAGHGLARVHVLAVVDLRRQNPAGIPVPLMVGSDGDLLALHQRDVQMQPQLWPFAVVSSAQMRQGARKIAIRQNHTDGIRLCVQQPRHVEALIVDFARVVAPERIGVAALYRAAVDFDPIVPQSGHV